MHKFGCPVPGNGPPVSTAAQVWTRFLDDKDCAWWSWNLSFMWQLDPYGSVLIHVFVSPFFGQPFLALAPGNALDETKWFMEGDQRWEKYEVPPGHPMGEGRIYYWSLDSGEGGLPETIERYLPPLFMRNLSLSLDTHRYCG